MFIQQHPQYKTSTATRNLVKIKKLSTSFAANQLVDFLFTYGLNEWQYCPIEAVTQHLLSLRGGEIDVWAAFDGPKLVGFISSRIGPHFLKYQQQNENKHGPTAEIVEYAVHPDYRNKGIGTTLVKKSKAGIFKQYHSVNELYVVHHADNIPSNRTFMKNGFIEVDTFDDDVRQQYTTVLKCKRGTGYYAN